MKLTAFMVPLIVDTTLRLLTYFERTEILKSELQPAQIPYA